MVGETQTEENNNKSEIALREERVLKFWKENKIFEKSLTKDAPRGNYVFYDGPPFATGVPHYGHILGSTVKDVIGRYQTMRGFRVPRRWGWDCHGLPIENIVEKDLGISGRKEIEALGIDKFAEHARSKVLTYVHEWKKTVDRIGRWVDFDNSYKTMDNTFIESVWWALGELHKKELLYEGVRVLAYCTRCETPIANSEIAMDNSYKDITDISVYVKFELKNKPKTYLLAWTTTPWTLPGNTAIAVNQSLTYLFVKNFSELGEETLIIAKDRFEILKDKFKNGDIIKEVSGMELIGLSYEPVFDYYKNIDMPNKENIWKVWHGDFVTTDMGTGIAHEAPAFGEDDMVLSQKDNIPFIRHVEPNGVFSKEVTDFSGAKVKPKEDHQSGDVLIIKHLAHKGLLFAKEKIVHSYPHCYRCDTPLLYYALPSWFVNIQKVKNTLLEKAKQMNWIPEHLKEGRFKNIMENAPDWTISRNRYWASPLPIWKSALGKVLLVNSLKDLKEKTKKSGNKYMVMRHGESESNIKDNMHGVVSSREENTDHITKRGEEQVKEAAQKLKGQKFDLVFVSPFARTRETLNILKEDLDLKDNQIIFDKRLAELDAGDFEGKTWDEYRSMFKDDRERFLDPIHGGESLLDVKKRMGDFMYELEEKYHDKNILIISHGAPLWMLYAVLSGYDVDQSISMTGGLFRHAEEAEKGMSGVFNHFANAELRSVDFVPIPHNKNYELDMHRPYIDALTLVDENGEIYKRIPEVIDCWFESGSMPFAQDHYPFENAHWKQNNFPAGFVAEYIAQTRTWFYYTHVISSILFNQAPFANIVTTGTVLAEDGSKMSKSKNNFPDPSILFDKYGVDALRLYLMSSTLMKGEDVNFSEKIVQEISSKIIGRLFNVVTFYELYRDTALESEAENLKPGSVLDQWILARLDQLVSGVTKGMQAYDMNEASKPFESFIEDLSTWYLRRSRDRIKEGNLEAKQTLYFVLKTIAKLLAPFAPFTAEDIWLKMRTKDDIESVHLLAWPAKKLKIFALLSFFRPKVLEKMATIRSVVTLGLEARQKASIKVRQPLNRIEIVAEKLSDEYLEIIKDELNIKNIDYIIKVKIGLNKVSLDTTITPELREEGYYRELVRAIQDIRKKMALTPSDIITLSVETDDVGKQLIKNFNSDIKKAVSASGIEFEVNNSDEIKIDGLIFKIKINV